MTDLQLVRSELAGSNKETIQKLKQAYINMFVEELELQNAKCIYYPSNVRVELIEDVKDNKLRSSKSSEEFNWQALIEVAKLLNCQLGCKAKVKHGKLFTKDKKMKLARRLVGMVRIG